MPTKATFHNIPTDCLDYNSTSITCYLQSKTALHTNQTTDVIVLVNINKIPVGHKVYINAWVSSSDQETNALDNFVSLSLETKEISEVEIIG